VEWAFDELTAKQLRRGMFRSVSDSIAAIDAYMVQCNAKPTSLVWTKTAREILAKVNRATRALDKTKTA